MIRREFISNACLHCISGTALISLLESCGSSKIITANIVDSDMIVPVADFRVKKSKTEKFEKVLVVQNEKLQYPICVYRFDDNHYEALLMKCTHQGTELQVFGDKLQCPAHGSEFNHYGKVQNGPANTPLRTFPITITSTELKISLK